ncbi:hypothetical protein O181_089152 [Austropuccinia psidii MF-1]|uniref:Uncharacterized protein n=1 Tax=Austropuccinia psidii MF-1 TaxID=1389203 RepID=A0A9Q3IT20_9BASI|nr:hypothetical protein [Austropuccinia psidii MF-1]
MLEGPSSLVVGKFIPAQRSPLQGSIAKVVPHSIGHQSSTSPSQPASRIFQSHIIPSTPRDFHPVISKILSSIPPPSPNPSTARPSLVSPVRPSPIPQPRNSPIITYQKVQPVASSSRRREDQFPLPFHTSQAFQKGERWPIRVTREDPNRENDGQDF